MDPNDVKDFIDKLEQIAGTVEIPQYWDVSDQHRDRMVGEMLTAQLRMAASCYRATGLEFPDRAGFIGIMVIRNPDETSHYAHTTTFGVAGTVHILRAVADSIEQETAKQIGTATASEVGVRNTTGEN